MHPKPFQKLSKTYVPQRIMENCENARKWSPDGVPKVDKMRVKTKGGQIMKILKRIMPKSGQLAHPEPPRKLIRATPPNQPPTHPPTHPPTNRTIDAIRSDHGQEIIKKS